MLVSEVVGRTLFALGGDVVFGLMGSGNLAVTNAVVACGGRFVSSRHETGAVCMADGYARVSGRLGVASVHQGPGLTNAITGLTEAAKSRTPLILLAADTPAAQLRSNFKIDQDALVTSVGAVTERVHGPATAVADVTRAVRRAVVERRTVVLMLPLDVQSAPAELTPPPPWPELAPVRPGSLDAVVEALAGAARPAIIGGRGAVLSGAGPALRQLGERSGAVLATSAVANGLFEGDPFAVGISGGFASPTAQRLLAESDVVVAFGAALNMWTTRHGALISPDTTVIQVDRDEEAIGAHRPVDLGVVGDARETAEALVAALGLASRPAAATRWPRRSPPAAGGTSRSSPRATGSTRARSRSRSTTCCPPSGPSSSTPARSWATRRCTCASRTRRASSSRRASSASGSRSGNAIGAALARPDRLTVAAVGDGGLLMALPDLETLGRVKPDLLVVIYDDAAYGAEVHHFRPLGIPVELAQFPPTDFAALAEAVGCRGLTARSIQDLEGVREWLEDRDRPLVLDAKVDPDICAEWLEEAFRGH